jgi:predicted SAM-dependent methyltransferase
MIEHLDPTSEVPRFLREVRRVLMPGGILRLAIPDLRRRVQQYLDTQDADEFVRSLHMTEATPRGLLSACATW